MSNTIWCVGRNYLDHAQEMKSEAPKTPLIFIKAWGCLTTEAQIKLPHFSQHIEHELELAVLLGENLQPKSVALALDLTARDIQSQLKQKGHPWALAKSFQSSCLIGPWVDYHSDHWFKGLKFELKVNDQLKQQGRTQDMIFSLKEIIDYLKEHFPLLSGDIVLTGTPAGVSKLKPGDQLWAQIHGHGHWDVQVEKDS